MTLRLLFVAVVGTLLVLGSAALGAVPTGPIPMYASFRDNCRPTVSPRDCLLGFPETPDRVGGDFEGGYTDQVAGVESVIDRDGNYHLRTAGSGPSSLRRIWLDLWEGSGARPFVINYAQETSFIARGPVPFYGMTVSTKMDPVPYVGTLEIRFRTETWHGMLLFDKITITRIDPDIWTITAGHDETVKLADRDRQALGTYAMPFSLTVKTLAAPHSPQHLWAPER